MADVVDKATRSRMMSGIRAKNTRPEMFLRRGLHALGFRFRLHAKDIPGKPDIVLPKYHALICIHGCFWHGHGCRYSKIPSSNTKFWQEKLLQNKVRDIRTLQQQREAGWRCLTVWECAIRSSSRLGDSQDVTQLASEWLIGESPNATIGLSSNNSIELADHL